MFGEAEGKKVLAVVTIGTANALSMDNHHLTFGDTTNDHHFSEEHVVLLHPYIFDCCHRFNVYVPEHLSCESSRHLAGRGN